MIVLIDNYDSFAHNLARYLSRLHRPVHVFRNDETGVDELTQLNPDLLVLSPGPRYPHQAGICIEAIQALHQQTPIFGVCLGHQAIAAAWGAKVVQTEPCHGRSSEVTHAGSRLFQGIPSPFPAARYHSLTVDRDSLPNDFRVTATTGQDVIMAIEHVRFPLVGVQFHPESILTEHGYLILANMLRIAGIEIPSNTPSFGDELRRTKTTSFREPQRPVTF